MKSFWLFRSNIRALEYYHEYKDLKTFKENCHDYYMLLPLWLVEHDYFDEVIIWRLCKKPTPDIVFNINGKKYIQRWVKNFSETLKYPSPDTSFWRGGFLEYDQAVSMNPKHFGFKLYLGAGRRVFSQYGGQYDIYLIEDERDYNKKYKCLPFYKTASPEIFYPLGHKIDWDICWPANFTQSRYKGQGEFIKLIGKSKYLQKLKIVHCGNKSEIGKNLCKKNNVTNIDFAGHIPRPLLNRYLNKSKFGLNLSNLKDGCPRVSTEILMSGTPLIVKDTVRLLKYFKSSGVIEVNNDNIVSQIKDSISNYVTIKRETLNATFNHLSFNKICQKNIDMWKKI